MVVSKIDKTAPELEVTGNASTWTKENVVVNNNVLISELPAHGAAVYRI